MSLNTFTAVRAALKTKLQTIAAFQNRVDDFHNPDLQGYPACTFDVSDNADDFLTNKDNIRSITFQIVVYQERKQLGLEASTLALDTVVDTVIAALENDFQLANGGQADQQFWCDAITIGRRSQFDTPNGPVLAQELTLKCQYAVLLS